jgi:hypothetical protein
MQAPGRLSRWQAWLVTLWAGAVVVVGGLAAPALFSVLPRDMAGTGAGRMFHLESQLSLFMAMLVFVMERRRVRDAVESGAQQSAMSATLLMTLVVLFLTIFGQHVLHPMIQAARQGAPSGLSFAALHGISAALYWGKALILLVMSWRLMAALSPAPEAHQSS